MANHVLHWEKLREEEFEGAIERSGGLCVIPIGCIEKHGQHLPSGCDSLHGSAVVMRAAAEADVTVFPVTMWLGNVLGAHAVEDPGATHRRGFIDISPTTQLTVMRELCDEIARNGYRKILFCNSHGGNRPMMEFFLTTQNYEKRNYATMSTAAYDWASIMPAAVLATYEREPEFLSMLTPEDIRTLRHYAENGTGGSHGDFVETALLYGTHPDLVEPSRFDAVDGVSTGRADYLGKAGVRCSKAWSINQPNCLHGYAPIGCTGTIGDAVVKIAVRRLAGIMQMLKQDENCVRFQAEGLL